MTADLDFESLAKYPATLFIRFGGFALTSSQMLEIIRTKKKLKKSEKHSCQVKSLGRAAPIPVARTPLVATTGLGCCLKTKYSYEARLFR